MSTQKLYRSRTDRVFAGVCGGLAEYFDVDPVVVRILFVLMVLFGGTGIVLYIAAIFIVPNKPVFIMGDSGAPEAGSVQPPGPRNEQARNWFGIALVVGGVFLLLANMELFHLFDFFSDSFEYVFPVLLIILGMAIIYYRQSTPQTQQAQQAGNEPASGEYSFRNGGHRQYKRSIRDKKIFGVCGGLADYFGIDASLIRMLYVVLCLASFGAGLILYILIAIIVPYEDPAKI